MKRTLATAHQCPRCGSIDVTIKAFGMPTQTFWNYMEAYEALSRAITMDALLWSDKDALDTSLFDEDEYSSWFCPEQGRGVYAPGNAYDHGGCVIFEEEGDDVGACTCRSCGMRFADTSVDDDEEDEEDEEEEEEEDNADS
jgi:hypothetical protein